MIRAEQMVYTTANIDGKKGYQVVAKSRGISSAIESSLRHHFHPRGVWPEDFRESHTLTVLGDGLIAYCHARNIGVGYDGRRDTLCSHALVLASDAFKEYGYDTRILDPLHPGSRRVRGELPAVEIDPPQLPPAGAGGLRQVLRGALGPVLSGKRTAVQSSDPTAAQDLLSLIPPSARLVPFSSMATDAEDVSRYNLVFFPPGKAPRRESGLEVIKPGSGYGLADGGAFGRSIQQYAQTVLEGGPQRVRNIQDRFEESPCMLREDRMVLACAHERFLEAPSEDAKKACAEDILSVIKGTDARSFSKYFDLIKNHIGPYRAATDSFHSRPTSSPDQLSLWWASFPVQIAAQMFLKFVDSYSRGAEADADDGDEELPQDRKRQERQPGPLVDRGRTLANSRTAETRAGPNSPVDPSRAENRDVPAGDPRA